MYYHFGELHHSGDHQNKGEYPQKLDVERSKYKML